MFAARWIAAAAFVVCVPVLLVLTNVRIAATEERVFDYGFSAYNVPAVTGLERAQMDAAAHEIVRYFTSGDSNSLLDIRVQTPTGSAQPLYSDREVIHMRDVKQLFQFFFRVHEVAFAYIVVYVAGVYLWAREQSLLRLARLSVIAGVATVGVMGFAAIAMVDSTFWGTTRPLFQS